MPFKKQKKGTKNNLIFKLNKLYVRLCCEIKNVERNNKRRDKSRDGKGKVESFATENNFCLHLFK